MRTMICAVCGEEQEWVEGYELVHFGGSEPGYFHIIMATPEPVD